MRMKIKNCRNMATHYSKTKYNDVRETIVGDITTERELYLTIQTTADIVYITDDRGNTICGQSVYEDGLLSAISRLCKAYEAWDDEMEPPSGVEYCGEPKYIEPSPLRKAAEDCIESLRGIVRLTEECTDRDFPWRKTDLKRYWELLGERIEKFNLEFKPKTHEP